MKRMRVLFGQRRMQLLVTAAVLLLAAGVVVGSGANFSTSAASPGNTFTAGYVALTPDGALSFGPLAPSGVPTPRFRATSALRTRATFRVSSTLTSTLSARRRPTAARSPTFCS